MLCSLIHYHVCLLPVRRAYPHLLHAGQVPAGLHLSATCANTQGSHIYSRTDLLYGPHVGLQVHQKDRPPLPYDGKLYKDNMSYDTILTFLTLCHKVQEIYMKMIGKLSRISILLA